MITKVGLRLDRGISTKFRTGNSVTSPVENNKDVSQGSNNSFPSVGMNYYVPFTGNDKNKENPVQGKYDDIMYASDTPTKMFFNKVIAEANDEGYPKATTLHILRDSLEEMDAFMDGLNSGDIDLENYKAPTFSAILNQINPSILTEEDMRKKVQPVIKKYISKTSELIEENKPKEGAVVENPKIRLSDDVIDAIWAATDEDMALVPSYVVASVFGSKDSVTDRLTTNIEHDIDDAIMKEPVDPEKAAPFNAYEPKATKLLKNIELGSSVFLTYDPESEDVKNFLDTVKKVNSQSDTQIVDLNEKTNANYFLRYMKSLGKDKNNKYIVLMNPAPILGGIATVTEEGKIQINISKPAIDAVGKPPKNVKFLFYQPKNDYYSLLEDAPFAKTALADFIDMDVPNLTSEQKINSFLENPNLIKDINNKDAFTKKALEKVAESSSHLDGQFPQKTIKLMQNISAYYVDKKEITEKDVDRYLNEAGKLLKKNSDDTSFEPIYNTGIKLKDLKGKESTKKEATSLVRQIKSETLGTKGVIVYSEDGTAGSGRRYTAKAIAGEAHIPYMEINTMDFGTKEVDILGGGPLSPEASIKKLFSIVRTQAESSPHKAAVLFIDNFELFSVGEEMFSMYHQKAMAQLLREMDRANAEGLNILVVGSVSDPSLIGPATMKSAKFSSLGIASPAFSATERYQVLKNVLQKSKFSVAGDKGVQDNTIKFAAKISDGFPFLALKNLVNQAHSVAKERGHSKITKADFTEAYLQVTTGRPSTEHNNPHEQNIVSSHECGHATNLEVMNNIAKTIGKPWHIPSKVNFITLDPRGMYGGAVYPGRDANRERSFESLFASLVLGFGGNSAEHRFYGMNGSLGITCDMEQNRNIAEFMVKSAGMGAKVGKMSIADDEEVSEDLKKMIESDERVILHNAKVVSDYITEVYSDFNELFTKKYAPKVGTGECLIDGDLFRTELEKWKKSQSPEKQEEIKLCDIAIQKVMEATKKGITVRREGD